MISISLCLSVKNKEKSLPFCIFTVKDVVDEIIIADLGSSDKTIEVARKFTDKVYELKDENNYSNIKEFLFSKSTKDYVLWLDADDILLDNDRLKLMQFKKLLDKKVDTVMLKYNYKNEIKEEEKLIVEKERLLKIRDNKDFKNGENEADEKIIYEDITITHRNVNLSETNSELCKDKMKELILSSKEKFNTAKELYSNNQYEGAINLFKDFLIYDEEKLEDKINAAIMLSKCYKAINDYNKAMITLLNTFIFEAPLAEVCCELGYCHKEKNQYKKAIQWFIIATSIDKQVAPFFIEEDYYDFIPFMELSDCYYNINNLGMAKYYHNKAKRIKPNESKVLENDNRFRKV